MAVLCERAFLAALDGSCRTPIAGHAFKDPESGQLKFKGLIATIDGSEVITGDGESKFGREAAKLLGDQVGREVKGKCGPHFFDWEEAQAGLRAPVQEKVAARA